MIDNVKTMLMSIRKNKISIDILILQNIRFRENSKKAVKMPYNICIIY